MNAEVGMWNAEINAEVGMWNAEFGIVEQESDESLYWLEILRESRIAKGKLFDELIVEADELVVIFTTIGRKSK